MLRASIRLLTSNLKLKHRPLLLRLLAQTLTATSPLDRTKAARHLGLERHWASHQ